jgi:hypothetical protein
MTYAPWIVQVLLALITLVVGHLAVFVAYGRSRLTPHRGRRFS